MLLSCLMLCHAALNYHKAYLTDAVKGPAAWMGCSDAIPAPTIVRGGAGRGNNSDINLNFVPVIIYPVPSCS